MKIIKILILLFFLLSISFGEEPIIITGDRALPPIEYLDSQGNPQGFIVDVMRELSKEIGKPIEIRLMPWKEAVKSLDEGKVSGIEFMRITKEREKKYDFVPIMESFSVIVVPIDSDIVNSLDIKNKRVAVLNLDVAHNFLANFSYVVPKDTQEEVLLSVLKREVSAGVVNYYFAKWFIYKKELQDQLKILPDKLITNYSGIALPKNSPLLPLFQKGISNLRNRGVLNKLSLKWFGMELITGETLKKGEKILGTLLTILLIALLVIAIFIGNRILLKRIIFQRTRELKERYEDIARIYNFLHESTSISNPSELEDLYTKNLRELLPNHKIKILRKVNGEINLEGFKGEKIPLRIGEELLGYTIIEPEITDKKYVIDILSQEFCHLLYTLKMKEETKRAEELSNLINEFSLFYSTRDTRLILTNILRKLLNILSANVGSIMTLSPEDNKLYITASIGLSEEVVKNVVLNVGEGIAGWCALHKEPLILEDTSSDPRFKAFEPKLHIKSSIVYPLIHEGKVLGVLNINSLEEKRKFSEKDLELVEKIAPLIASFLEQENLEKRISRLNKEALLILVEAIEARDPYTGGHVKAVTDYSLKMGEFLKLDREELKTLEMASYLHDVGKIKVPDDILKAPRKLTPEEWEIMKMHPIWGEEFLKKFTTFKDIAKIVRHHHERWDGKGYPDGLSGENIPFLSRIIVLSDSFQAMTSIRPYKKALSLEEAVEEIRKEKGKQFDPELAEIFIEVVVEDLIKEGV